MSTLLNIFILITIQLSFTSAALPLKCFLQNYPFSNIFSKNAVPASFYEVYKINPLRLDPIKAAFIRVAQDDFFLETKDLEYIGLKDAILDEFGLNMNSKLVRMNCHFDLLVKGLYKTGGTLFSIPISGDGIILGSLKNVIVDMVMPFNIIQDENGRKVIELQKFYYWQDIVDNAEFNFSNLYNGDKEKSNAMHYLINQNWKMFTLQYGKPYMEQVVRHAFNVIKNYLLSMPLNNLATC